MHPYLRALVITAVAMLIAGGLVAIALIGRDTTVSVLSLLGAGIVAVVMGGWLFWQSWAWSQRIWRQGSSGRALGVAVIGGVAIVGAGLALAASVILLLTFGLG